MCALSVSRSVVIPGAMAAGIKKKDWNEAAGKSKPTCRRPNPRLWRHCASQGQRSPRQNGSHGKFVFLLLVIVFLCFYTLFSIYAFTFSFFVRPERQTLETMHCYGRRGRRHGRQHRIGARGVGLLNPQDKYQGSQGGPRHSIISMLGRLPFNLQSLCPWKFLAWCVNVRFARLLQ